VTLRIPYTSREFETILSEIRDRMRAELPDSNDFLESNVGRFMIELYAAVGDMIAFNMDRQAAECYVDTVETREHLVGLLRLIGFQPFNPVPEETAVRFSREAGQPLDTTINVPKGTRLFSSATSLPWVTTAAAVLSPSVSSVLVQAKQGEYRTLNFVSSGNPFQEFLINSRQVAEGEVFITVDGTTWNQAEQNSLVGEGPDAPVFQVVRTQDQRTIVQFGDNIDGSIPAKGSAIAIQVFLTEHVNGRATTGQIDQLVDTLTAPVTVRNPDPSRGGADFETVASARIRFPEAFATQKRAVTRGDYEAQAKLVPGVLQAKAVDNQLDPTVPLFSVHVFVVGNDGSVSSTLNDEVEELLNERKVNVMKVTVKSPTPIEVRVQIDELFVYRDFVPSEVESNVLTAIDNFFILSADDTGEIALGTDVALSRLFATISAVEGVSSFRKTVWVNPLPLDDDGRYDPLGTPSSGDEGIGVIVDTDDPELDEVNTGGVIPVGVTSFARLELASIAQIPINPDDLSLGTKSKITVV